MEITNNGNTVSRNGITMTRPKGMGFEHWKSNVAPRVGKAYSSKSDILFGHWETKPKSGSDDQEDGCGGACAI